MTTTTTTSGGTLPTALTRFVGRGRDLAEVRRLLCTSRLLTLTGVGGVGKTRLALEAARASREEFPDGVFLVDLAPLQDASTVVDTAAAALGVPDLDLAPLTHRLVSHIAGRRVLIVMDNCEHLADACAELTHTLLVAAPEVHVLATSRRPMGIIGEHLFPVPTLNENETIELLVDRATAVQPHFRLTDENRAAAVRICAELDGLPLAIELAACRLRTLTVEQLADRLEERFALLAGDNRTAAPRHRSLQALIEYSYELCSPAEQLLWNRLSVFAGGFGLDAAEDVASEETIAKGDVLGLLDRLVSQSIVLTCQHGDLPRYRLLGSIRQYGHERLAESGEEERLRRRHVGFYLALTQRIADGWCGPGQAESLARLRAEHSNLQAALGYGDAPQVRLALVTALRHHWYAGGFLGEGRRQLTQALVTAPEPTSIRGQALWVAARVALLQGDHGAARLWAEEAAELAERLNDEKVRAHVHVLHGALAQFQGRLEDAISHGENAVAAYDTADDTFEMILSLGYLTVLRTALGDPDASDAAEQAVSVAEEHGERLGRALVLGALAYAAHVRGNQEMSIALTMSALEIHRDFENYVWVALLLELLAWASASRGVHKQAGQLLGAARSLSGLVSTNLYATPDVAERHTLCENAVLQELGAMAYEKALAEGSRCISPGEAITFALAMAEVERPATAAMPKPLTRREREVAELVANGMSNRQIASALGLSPRTADRHVENILDKFDFRSRAQIAAWWVESRVTMS